MMWTSIFLFLQSIWLKSWMCLSETGRLGKGYRYRLLCPGFDVHPDTDASITDRTLLDWAKTTASARQGHRVFAGMVFLGWDIAFTPRGPVILEGNSGWDVVMVQMPQRTPLGQTRFVEVCLAHMDVQENSPHLLAAAQTSDPAEIALKQIVRFFHCHWRFIGAWAVAAGLMVGLSTLVSPRRYTATATLVIIQPKLSSELKSQTLTMPGYQQLLESDAILAETAQQLIARGVLEEGTVLRVGKRLKTHIFVSKQWKEETLAPMLQVEVRSKTPDQTAAIADTWAQVFIERTQSLMHGTTSDAVQFIDREYPRAQERLAELEEERASLAEEFQQRFDAAANRWDETNSMFGAETTALTATFQAETLRLTSREKISL